MSVPDGQPDNSELLLEAFQSGDETKALYALWAEIKRPLKQGISRGQSPVETALALAVQRLQPLITSPSRPGSAPGSAGAYRRIWGSEPS